MKTALWLVLIALFAVVIATVVLHNDHVLLDSLRAQHPLWNLPVGEGMVALSDVKIVVMGMSGRYNFERRAAQRAVLRLTPALAHTRFLWFVGNETCPTSERKITRSKHCDDQVASEERIAIEIAKYPGQITELPMIDSYEALPRKLKLALSWSLAAAPRAKWLVKVDDDVVMFLQRMEVGLLAMDATGPVLAGHICHTCRVNLSGKWKEANYPPGLYPPFPLGSFSYAASRPVAAYVADKPLTELFEYQGEDTSMGIWMDTSPFNRTIQWKNLENFRGDGTCGSERDPWLIGHDVSAEKMISLFEHCK
jgi:hypothetical protein